MYFIPFLHKSPIAYAQPRPGFLRNDKVIIEQVLDQAIAYYTSYNHVVGKVDGKDWLVRLCSLLAPTEVDLQGSHIDYLLEMKAVYKDLLNKFNISHADGVYDSNILVVDEGDFVIRQIYTATPSLEPYIMDNIDKGLYLININNLISALWEAVASGNNNMQHFVARHLLPPLIRDNLYNTVIRLGMEPRLRVKTQTHAQAFRKLTPLIKKISKDFKRHEMKDAFTKWDYINVFGFYSPLKFRYPYAKFIAKYILTIMSSMPNVTYQTAMLFVVRLSANVSNNILLKRKLRNL